MVVYPGVYRVVHTQGVYGVYIPGWYREGHTRVVYRATYPGRHIYQVIYPGCIPREAYIPGYTPYVHPGYTYLPTMVYMYHPTYPPWCTGTTLRRVPPFLLVLSRNDAQSAPLSPWF